MSEQQKKQEKNTFGIKPKFPVEVPMTEQRLKLSIALKQFILSDKPDKLDNFQPVLDESGVSIVQGEQYEPSDLRWCLRTAFENDLDTYRAISHDKLIAQNIKITLEYFNAYHYKEVAKPQPGDIVVYYQKGFHPFKLGIKESPNHSVNDEVMHYARVLENGKYISTWGRYGLTYEHPPDMVPKNYGDARIFLRDFLPSPNNSK